MLALSLREEPAIGLGFLDALSARDEPRDPIQRADRLAAALRATRDDLVVPLTATARSVVDREAWTRAGYATCGDLMRERFHSSARRLRDLAALDVAMRSLPSLATALTGRDGGPPLGRCAALAIGRTANEESVATWIDLARNATTRELRHAIRVARNAKSVWPLRDPPPNTPEEIDPDADDFVESVRVGMWLPRAARLAFENTRVFHSVLAGRETGIAAFIEALVAESESRLSIDEPGSPNDVVTPPNILHGGDGAGPGASISRGDDGAGAIPNILHGGQGAGRDPNILQGGDGARRFRTAPRSSDAGAGMRTRSPRADGPAVLPWPELEAVLARAQRYSRADTTEDIAELLDRLAALIELEEEIERALGRILAFLQARAAWLTLGFESMADYAEDRLGWGHSTAASRAWLARSLGHMPHLRKEYEAGRIGFAATTLARRAVGSGANRASTEAAWATFAGNTSIKRLRDELRIVEGKRIENPAALDILPSSAAEWHASLRRAPGETCQRIAILMAIAMERPPHPDLADALPDTTREFPRREDGHGRSASGARANVFLAISLPEELERRWRHAIERSCQAITARTGRSAPPWVGMLEILWHFVSTWDDPQSCPKRQWDEIYARDDWRCMAPGCTARINLQDHHIVYRSHQGSDEPWNQICLCAFHHQQGEHGELAMVRGRAPLGLTWRLGEPALARWYRNEQRIDPP